MRILYVIKNKPGDTFEQIIKEQQKDHEIEVVDLRKTADYDSMLEQMATADRVISW